MTEVEELVARVLAPWRRLAPAERLTYAQALLRHAGVDAYTASERELRLRPRDSATSARPLSRATRGSIC